MARSLKEKDLQKTSKMGIAPAKPTAVGMPTSDFERDFCRYCLFSD
jgi:hypothetical protein